MGSEGWQWFQCLGRLFGDLGPMVGKSGIGFLPLVWSHRKLISEQHCVFGSDNHLFSLRRSFQGRTVHSLRGRACWG